MGKIVVSTILAQDPLISVALLLLYLQKYVPLKSVVQALSIHLFLEQSI